MTTLVTAIGAPSAKFSHWTLINWEIVKNHVQRLQLRIAKAIKLKRHGKAKTLQWLLTQGRVNTS
jgi:RNA-directed DNA polymerase